MIVEHTVFCSSASVPKNKNILLTNNIALPNNNCHDCSEVDWWEQKLKMRSANRFLCLEDFHLCYLKTFRLLVSAALPEVILRNCRNCSPQQAQNAQKLTNFLQTRYPEVWAMLIRKYRDVWAWKCRKWVNIRIKRPLPV